MFKLAVILVHSFIFILASIVGLGGVYSPSSSEPGETYWLWFSIIVIFNILVWVSAFVQLRIKKVWVFLLTIIGLLVLFIFTLSYIYPYLMDLFIK